MRITTDDGVGLEVDVRGDGPPLLIVHGFGGAADDFADHRDALARTHRVVTFDHRGHGRSEGPDHVEYSLERLRHDVLLLADALELDRFRLLTYSMGGMAARRIPLEHPERVEALVLMSTCGGPIPMLDPEVLDLGAQLAEEQGMAAVKRVLDDSDPLHTPATQRLLRERSGYAEYLEWKWSSLAQPMYAAMLREMSRQPDDHEALRALRCPTLVIVGELDGQFLEPCRRLAAVIPGARLVVLPGAGHSPQFETPELWRAALLEFLAGVDEGAAV